MQLNEVCVRNGKKGSNPGLGANLQLSINVREPRPESESGKLNNGTAVSGQGILNNGTEASEEGLYNGTVVLGEGLNNGTIESGEGEGFLNNGTVMSGAGDLSTS